MKRASLLLAITLAPLALRAQVNNPSIVAVTTSPAGQACTANLPIKLKTPDGSLCTCQNGTYACGAPGSSSGGVINAALMPHWFACTAKIKIAAGSCRVYAIGDSTTGGFNSAASGDLTVASYPTRLSQYLASTLVPAQRDSFMGNPVLAFADARVIPGSWANQFATSTAGPMLESHAATTTPFSFHPTDNVDTFVIWYPINNLGSFSYNVDGGSPTTVSEAGTGPIQSVTVNAGSLASHTLNLNWVSGSAYIIGEEAYNSAVNSIRVTNAGWTNSASGDWVAFSSQTYAPINAVTTQAPDLILLDLGINDWRLGTPVATYTAQMQALITAWKVNSDVVLVTPAPSEVTTVPLATQKLYIAALQQLATTNSIPIIDNFNRWVTWESKNPAPFSFYSGSDIHPNANGYSDFAQSITSQILSIVGH